MKEQVAEIVSAYLRNNTVPADQLPGLITSVHSALGGLGNTPVKPASTAAPVVSIRASIRPDALTCLTCGKKSKMLKRHLTTAHGMSPDEYRTRWSLPSDYPMVAKNYSARRSELAKSAGLGTQQRSRRSPRG
jgi:predicted transcriptional regulator